MVPNGPVSWVHQASIGYNSFEMTQNTEHRSSPQTKLGMLAS